MIGERLLTTKEAAAMLGVSQAFLERDRWMGATIPYVRIGKRTIRYNPQVIREIMKNQISGLTKVNLNFAPSSLSANR